MRETASLEHRAMPRTVTIFLVLRLEVWRRVRSCGLFDLEDERFLSGKGVGTLRHSLVLW